MHRATLPLTGAEPTYIVCAPQSDGTAILYEASDELPASLAMPMPMPPPAILTARQIRLALNQMGLRDAVEAAVAAGGRDLRDWWEYSVELHREHPMIGAMAQAIGATPEQVDALWRLGAGI